MLLRLTMAMPKAKLAVVMIPMAASEPIGFLRVVHAISSADRNPQMVAPMKKLIDMMALTTAPPKTAWDKPMPDVRHSAQDYVHPHESAESTDQAGRDDGPHEKPELEGF